MKKITLLSAILGLTFSSFGQNSDLEAQYAYAQAEENYSKAIYPDAISFCEKASGILGSTNQKILFLELEAYHGLLKKKCGHALLSEIPKVDQYLNLYLDSLGKNADKSKLFTIMKFRDEWNAHKATGCPVVKYISWSDLKSGIKFETYKYHEKHGPFHVDVFDVPEIGKLMPGPFKSKTSLDNGLRISAITITAMPATTRSATITENLKGKKGDEVEELLNKNLKALQDEFPETTNLTIGISGQYSGAYETKTKTYEVVVPVFLEQAK